MDLWGWYFDRDHTGLSERQRQTLERIQQRARVTVRGIRMHDFDAEVGRFYRGLQRGVEPELGLRPHAGSGDSPPGHQLKQIINPQLGIRAGDARTASWWGCAWPYPTSTSRCGGFDQGGCCRSAGTPCSGGGDGFLRPGSGPSASGPDYQHLALGPLLYREIVDRLAADPYIRTAEASWTLATNHRINNQLVAMGGRLARRCGGCTSVRPAGRAGAGRHLAGQGRSLLMRSTAERARSKPTRARSMSCAEWVAMTEVRSMARGTAGGMAQLVYTPFSSKDLHSIPALQLSPTCAATIGLSTRFRHLVAQLGEAGAQLLGPGQHRLPAPVFRLGDAGRVERRPSAAGTPEAVNISGRQVTLR